MRALVDRIEAVVAIDLLDIEVAGVAIAAMNLDGMVIGGEAEFRRPAFRHRGQQPQQGGQPRPLGFVAGNKLAIDQMGTIEDQRQRAL